MYIITINGKKHKFRTLHVASAMAQEIFEKTGVVVGIEQQL